MNRSECRANRDTGAVKFEPSALCSRKLWQLVSGAHPGEVDERELARVVAELAKRRRYLEELAKIGKLGEQSNH